MNQFNLPLCLRVKEGIIKEVPSIIASCANNSSLKKPILVVTDASLYDIFEVEIQNLVSLFHDCELYFIKDSSFNQAVELAKYLCLKDIKIVIGFGGGKVLDTTKYASFVAKINYFCIPTTLSNDGIASPVAVLNIEKDKRKSFGCRIPSGIIIDINIVSNTPIEMLKAGIGDTLSNYTALYDWSLDQKSKGGSVDDFAYMLSDMSFSLLYYNEEKSLRSKEFIKSMAQSLVLSGLAMEIAGNSRPCSGSEHLFSHSLDENYKDIKISHGMAVALGSVVACMLQKRDYHLLLDYLKVYQISIKPLQWGITKEIFVDAWLKAKDTRKERYTILNEINLSRELLEDIYDIIQEEL